MSIPIFGFSQRYYDFSDKRHRVYNLYGAGTSSLTGIALSNSLHYNYRNNDFVLDFNFQRQINNRHELSGLKENDRITGVSFQYGRTVCFNKVLLGLSLGGGYVKYVDKYITSEFVPAGYGIFGSWDDHFNYSLNTIFAESGGLSGRLYLNTILTENLGIGISVYGNYNYYKSYFGVALIFNQIVAKSKLSD